MLNVPHHGVRRCLNIDRAPDFGPVKLGVTANGCPISSMSSALICEITAQAWFDMVMATWRMICKTSDA
jgi:hypothetical protein